MENQQILQYANTGWNVKADGRGVRGYEQAIAIIEAHILEVFLTLIWPA